MSNGNLASGVDTRYRSYTFLETMIRPSQKKRCYVLLPILEECLEDSSSFGGGTAVKTRFGDFHLNILRTTRLNLLAEQFPQKWP